MLHDSDQRHKVQVIQDLLHHRKQEVFDPPPYSPDMSPCCYDLFPMMKKLYEDKDSSHEKTLNML